MTLDQILASDFASYAELSRAASLENGSAVALIDGDRQWTHAEFAERAERTAAGLQAAGVGVGDTVAICAGNRAEYLIVFFGALRIGAAAALLPPSASTPALRAMLHDCGASIVFCDGAGLAALRDGFSPHSSRHWVCFDQHEGMVTFDHWVAAQEALPSPVRIAPDCPFNIIYSSGTTGTPKGIVHPSAMRWAQLRSRAAMGYGADTVTLASTPLYSNTTLVTVLPTLALGGRVVLMRKFETAAFLHLAETYKVTHAILVPAQYRRLLADPTFDSTDLSAFRMKFSTSAPLAADMKAEILRRWPGGLVEYYGMTEGGGTCMLLAHEHPDKLHTVGRPMAGHDIRVIDDTGMELGVGETGEVVGHSSAMMLRYHNNPEATASAIWRDNDGKAFMRTGDIGRFDSDGFLTLLDRKKDMIISGGFNIYPSDLEAIMAGHPAVLEVAVVGAPSERWGESPVAVVVLRPGNAIAPETLRDWANGLLGKLQKLARVKIVSELPRSAIGKVLKRELRTAWIEQEPPLD